MYGLNIHLQSFDLNRHLFNKHDKIRVSITTIPDERKEAFVINANEIYNVHHFFTINVSDKSTKIIFVFRKKSFIENDPIIASTVVNFKDLPHDENDKSNTEMKNIDIYEPISNERPRYMQSSSRRVFGHMQVQFTPTEAFPAPTIHDNYNHYKKKKTSKFSNVNVSHANNQSYGKYGAVNNTDENQYNNFYKQQNYNHQPENQYQQPQNQHQQPQNQHQQPQNQYQQPQNQYQQPQNQHQQPQNQYQQPQNQYQQQPQQNQYQQQTQNQYQQQQNQYQQQQNQYQQPQQNQYQQQTQQNQYQQQQNNQYQQQQNQYQQQQNNQYQQQQNQYQQQQQNQYQQPQQNQYQQFPKPDNTILADLGLN